MSGIGGFGGGSQEFSKADVGPTGLFGGCGAEGGLVAARSTYDPEDGRVARLRGRIEVGRRRGVDGDDLGLGSRG